jgi:DNA repair exonuclease SbcCD ATPase subunit
MAQVTIDISEYDALREAKAKAEQEVKELKETIKDLKKGSKVIFQTKYVRGDVDGAKRYIRSKCLGLSYADHLTISRILESLFGGEPRETTQYINFKDVEAQVEAGISEQKKKELEDAIEYYKKAAQKYETKNAGLEEEYQKQKEAYENASKPQIDKLNEEIKYLNDRIAELKKSRNEKIAELEAQIDEAEAKLSDLGARKKGWFNRMFK